MKSIALPASLQPNIDHVVDACFNSHAYDEELKILHRYLEDDGWDALIAGSDDTIGLNFSIFADNYLADEMLRSFVGLDRRKKISDVDRLIFARKMLSHHADEFDELINPSIVHCTIKDQIGREMVLGGFVEIHGQSGPEISWCTPSRSHAHFLQKLKRKGVISIHEIGKLSDRKILKAWRI
jgi:hypothetical protein